MQFSPYDARIQGREILTPAAPVFPRLTGPVVWGARPGRPLHHRLSATGEGPVSFHADGLPPGVELDSSSGWISGRAPLQNGDYVFRIEARNRHSNSGRKMTLRVGETIGLTPPLGWNSWYVYSEGISAAAIQETAQALLDKGLAAHGWTYVNIDDCWMGMRNPRTGVIEPNSSLGDMKCLAEFVHQRGLKLGIYSTPWMATYAGFMGGSAPNDACDYSEYILPEARRQNPHQLFGRYPNAIQQGLAQIGPCWHVDVDAQQFAEWGIDYIKYDWKEWTLQSGDEGFWPLSGAPQHKTAATARRVYENVRDQDRDILVSFSPDHDTLEDTFVRNYCNLWRLTPDIHAEWRCLLAPFQMEERLQLTRPGAFGDLDMLQIGPLGKPNRAEVTYHPSPLTPAEQYFQVTLWCILTQPLLLSCHVPTMDEFDINLVTNDEVLAVNQDPLCRQGYRLCSEPGQWEIWAKALVDGSTAVALFNLAETDMILEFSAEQLGMTGHVRDLWRQAEVAFLEETFQALVSSHGAAFFRVHAASPEQEFLSQTP